MDLIAVFFRRRMWIQTHRWLSELSLTLVLPVGLYLCIAVGLRNIVHVSPGDVPFQAWILPGIVFIVALLSSYFPIFIDLFENRRLLPFFESIAGSPNSGLSIVTALAISLLPDVILRCLVAGIILQLLAGFALQVLPFLGLMFFVAILSVLVVNLALTITLMTRNSMTHLFGAFILLLFVILSSGWIIPLDSFPPSLSRVFAAMPTAQLMEGGRALVFHREITILTWLIPLGVTLPWLVLNSVVFTRVNTQ